MGGETILLDCGAGALQSGLLTADALGKACRAKRTVFIHHAPQYTDNFLDKADRWLRSRYPNCTFGRCGEEFAL
jgi:phosphoribosyl 1,2-cyclic phosphodiesterase